MRILHTADWHLNDRLGRIDRTGDLRAAVERVAHLCESERADVLIVAGDLFSELARPDALRETIRHWQEVFEGFLARKGTILALTGNHDNENFCRTLIHAMTLAAPLGRTQETVLGPGRVYLAAEPGVVKLADPTGRFTAQFLLMPFPTPSRYLAAEAGDKYANFGEKNQALTQAFNRTLAGLRDSPGWNPKLPSVLAAHIHVHGSALSASLFRLTEAEDVIIDGEELGGQFDYVALGHIHRPQALADEHVRYSGPIDRLDLGEANNSLGVVAFDLAAEGLVGVPAVLPLPATELYEIRVLDPDADLPRLEADYPDAGRDLVKLEVHYTAGEHNLEAVLRHLERIFPRWYARDWFESTALGPTLAGATPAEGRGFRTTVLGYLEQELIQHADAERRAILELARGLLDSEDGAS